MTNKIKSPRQIANERYIAKNYAKIQCSIPKEYELKLQALQQKLNISKAQTIKNAIDMYFLSVFGDMDD